MKKSLLMSMTILLVLFYVLPAKSDYCFSNSPVFVIARVEGITTTDLWLPMLGLPLPPNGYFALYPECGNDCWITKYHDYNIWTVTYQQNGEKGDSYFTIEYDEGNQAFYSSSIYPCCYHFENKNEPAFSEWAGGHVRITTYPYSISPLLPMPFEHPNDFCLKFDSDFNRDCVVDFCDFALLANDWLYDCSLTENLVDDNRNCWFGIDLDGTGLIDINDVNIFASEWLSK